MNNPDIEATLEALTQSAYWSQPSGKYLWLDVAVIRAHLVALVAAERARATIRANAVVTLINQDLARMEAENKRILRLLESLTPMGSEFADDPERCAAWVQERWAAQQSLNARLVVERDQAVAEIDVVEAHNKRLMAALEQAIGYIETQQHVLGPPRTSTSRLLREWLSELKADLPPTEEGK